VVAVIIKTKVKKNEEPAAAVISRNPSLCFYYYSELGSYGEDEYIMQSLECLSCVD